MKKNEENARARKETFIGRWKQWWARNKRKVLYVGATLAGAGITYYCCRRFESSTGGGPPVRAKEPSDDKQEMSALSLALSAEYSALCHRLAGRNEARYETTKDLHDLKVKRGAALSIANMENFPESDKEQAKQDAEKLDKWIADEERKLSRLDAEIDELTKSISILKKSL